MAHDARRGAFRVPAPGMDTCRVADNTDTPADSLIELGRIRDAYANALAFLVVHDLDVPDTLREAYYSANLRFARLADDTVRRALAQPTPRS